MLVESWKDLVVLAVKVCKELNLSKEYNSRLVFELKEIDKQGANNYWIRLYNSATKFEHNNNGLVLPFLLGITNVDPIQIGKNHIIEYHPDFPDIDIDFLPEARDSVKQYAEDKYGSDHVCSVGLWQTYNAKLALQDAATVLGYNRHEAISVCKNLPEEFDKMPLKQALEEFENFREFAKDKPDVVQYAYKMMGKVKAQGKHAGGIIISAVPIKDYVPLTLCGDQNNKQWTSAWTEGMAATQLSKFGFVKFDLLGLRNISYIYNCKRLIKQNRGVDIDFEDIDPRDDRAGWVIAPNRKRIKIRLNDPKTLKAADQVKMDSIFQFDTDFQKSIIEKGGVKSFMDLVIYTSLGRPGPLPMIDVYIKNRNDPNENWKNNLHPMMLDILEETKGVLTFQEQLLRIWAEICGFTMPEAEAAQTAVKKKKIEILDEIGPKVIKGASTIIGQQEAEDMWDKMVSFGRYCFNKCLSYDTILVDPITGESITIEQLYQTKKLFNLLSYDGNKFFVDEVVNIHYNGEQEVFEVEFSHGIKQTVTKGHKFMNEFGDMEEVSSLLKSNHAIKYMRDAFTSSLHEVFIKEKASGRCYIINIKNLGVKATYSPEMKSEYHNYITSPNNEEVIHANSHAVGYILIAYRCLWLKTHFPAEWWAAVLSECPTIRTVRYMGSARAEEINFGSINANRLTTNFSVNGDKVVPGVSSIKGIGKSSVNLSEESNKGPFISIDNFVERCGKSKITAERLIKLGAFNDLYHNRKALWMYYQYKYDSGKDASAFKKSLNHCYTWDSNIVFEERNRQIDEFKRLYPKRTKIPPKILNWYPITPIENPKEFDKSLELSMEQIKAAKKINLGFEQVVKLFPVDYTLSELLEFEKEFLGYYWNSPLDIFRHKANTTIEHAKLTGVLECVIEESYVRQGARGDYRILNVTDGINTARVNVWNDVLEENDEELFEVGRGVKIYVNWQDKWRSFSAKRGKYVMELEPMGS
jgi:DNA polymerase III alpha subunit